MAHRRYTADDLPIGLTMDTISTSLGYGGWHTKLTDAQKAEINAVFDLQAITPPEHSNQVQALTAQMTALEAHRLPNNKMRDERTWHDLASQREDLQTRLALSKELTRMDLLDRLKTPS